MPVRAMYVIRYLFAFLILLHLLVPCMCLGSSLLAFLLLFCTLGMAIWVWPCFTSLPTLFHRERREVLHLGIEVDLLLGTALTAH